MPRGLRSVVDVPRLGAPAHVRLWMACLALAGATTAVAGESRREAWPRVFIREPLTAFAVRSSLKGAAQRLGRPACQAVFADFQDQAGRPLRERLGELNETAPTYLDNLFFRDGSKEEICRRENVIAFTVPGSRVVFVCGRKFYRTWEQSPPHAQAMLIHELLHTLGLGEDPPTRMAPTSMAITQRVIRRCGG